ncbi:dTDP-4-dehydrorhamnose reductase [Bordetella sp. 02P26C-1]|uniref:dTDP-4-dehydrorhamnose reductase n=1 Tax=Bordetella sp. 02P26C-1 TaxID=2683195 RepID=UPI001354FDF3|nr:dTDP-4-dehydrorhamnose reductase [Bordetella sp. 02P26C-1]
MKILLVGKNGQVGQALQQSLAALGHIVAVDRQRCDLGDPQTVLATLDAEQPDIIVNAAAYTDVDRAETEPELAMKINAHGPRLLAKEAEASGAMLIHYSTDYVFKGDKDAPYVETDSTAPQSSYGRSKLAGEEAVAQESSRYLLLRTSWVHSGIGKNFVKTILRLAQNQAALKVVADQIGAPTSAAMIAHVTADLISFCQKYAMAGLLPNQKIPYGCYHLTALGQTSWHAYACLILDLARQAGMVLKASPETVTPIPTAAYPLPAARPANSRLDTTKLRQAFGVSLDQWQDGVQQTIAQLAR